MKKVLLTSTAMVAFAGAAAAEVTLSGWAEMGVAGGQGQTLQFFHDVDIDFTLSGESDNGIAFGANVDLDEAGNLGGTGLPFDDGGVDVFLSGDFGTVTLGDTDGAMDWAVDGIDAWGNPGSIADDETAHWGRQDTWLDGSYDGQILRYDYTFGDFGVAVSVEQDDRSDVELDADGDSSNDNLGYAIGARWTPEMGAGALDLGIGYQYAQSGAAAFGLTDLQTQDLTQTLIDGVDSGRIDDDELEQITAIFGFDNNAREANQLRVSLGEDAKVFGLSAGYVTDSGISIGGVWSSWDGKDLKEGTYYGVGAGYAWEAFSIHGNWGKHDLEAKAGGSVKTDGYGFAMGYDMGGGLSVLAGYGRSKGDITIGDEKFKIDGDTYSLGLSMAF